MSSSLRIFLRDLNMITLFNQFEEERVEISMINTMTDLELTRLGVTTIGDRHRLREKARQMVTVSSESSTITPISQQSQGSVQRIRNQMFGRTSRLCAKKTKKKHGWTATFVCLADNHQQKVPTPTEKEILRKSGLGMKNIFIEADDSEEVVINKLMSDIIEESDDTQGFPKLKLAGGFELMRTLQNSRTLSVIDGPYTAKELKMKVGCQARLYVRPIQCCLSTKPIKNENKKQEVKVECHKCHEFFFLCEMRKHTEVCLKIPSDEETSEVYVVASHDNGESSALSFVDPEPFIQGYNGMSIVLSGELSDTTNVQPRFSEVSLFGEPSMIPLSSSETIISASETSQFGEPIRIQPSSNETVISASETAISPEAGETSRMQAHSWEMEAVEVSDGDLSHSIENIIQFCIENNIQDPVEILRKSQSEIIVGRGLDITDPTDCLDGETFCIYIDRDEVLQCGMEEIEKAKPTDLRKTINVVFYGELAVDLGGPRREFFRLILLAIKVKYFDNGLRELLWPDYKTVGTIFALSILQNGKLPTFLDPVTLEQLWQTNPLPLSRCIQQLQLGFDVLGLFKVFQQLPGLRFLLHKTNNRRITLDRLQGILKPEFSLSGSNAYNLEKKVYQSFVRYLRAVAAGDRPQIGFHDILAFATSSDDEPVLGFSIKPSIAFPEVQESYIPTANTCINQLNLPRPSQNLPTMPSDEMLFGLYDYAFTNQYYGLK